MKKLLLGAVALGAIAATPAAAQSSQVHYARPIIGATGSFTSPYDRDERILILGNELALDRGIGTRYTTATVGFGNSQPTTPTVSVAFTLTGKVNPDCSFYAGNNDGARNIDFGVIGVRTGNNENVNDAFEMVGPAAATIQTLTAGCNFNNEVKIAKDNVDGMVNSAAAGTGYDSNQFQANIPYSVRANWTGVAQGAKTIGTGQTLAVAANQLSNNIQQGAWRSAMSINIVAERISDKGLVAGDYTGTTTLTLRAL